MESLGVVNSIGGRVTRIASCVTLLSLGLLAGPADAAPFAYYSFDVDTTTDSSGNGRDLTVSGGTTLAAGKFGTAAAFDGVNDFLWRNDPLFNFPGNFAISFWYQTDILADTFQPLVSKVETTGNLGYATSLSSSGNVAGEVNDNTNGDSVNEPRPPPRHC